MEVFPYWNIPDICHGYHGSYPWRKNLSCGEISNFFTWQITEISPHVESFESSPHDICGAIWNILHYQQIMCTIYGVLSHFMLLCCKISFIWIYAVLSQNRFVAIYALLRGENLSQKLCPWRKNDKYEVWFCYNFHFKFLIFVYAFAHHQWQLGARLQRLCVPLSLSTPAAHKGSRPKKNSAKLGILSQRGGGVSPNPNFLSKLAKT